MTENIKTFEFDGKTVEDAIRSAANVLNVSREMLQIKVVCEEQRGLFGMEGVKQAKIKVSIKTKKS